MRTNLNIALRFTVVTTLVLGVIYPLGITGLAQILFPYRANGQLVENNGSIVGSRIIGQLFSGPDYFHSRPSAAGAGYDATSSGGSNLAPTNKALIDRVEAAVRKTQMEDGASLVPIDLVTVSGSGLDPDISPAAAEFQVQRIARERHMSEADVRALVQKHTLGRQFGFLGEPRVRVLDLNLELDEAHPLK